MGRCLSAAFRRRGPLSFAVMAPIMVLALLILPAGGVLAQTVFTTQEPPGFGSDGPYERGMTVSSAEAGNLTAIRYWKAPGDDVEHIGRIWNANGNQLVGVTFADNTGSGWKQQALTTPLPIDAGTTYTVSVNSGTSYPFGNDLPVTNDPLTGSAGVFNASPGELPIDSFGVHYFRDVVLGPPTVSGACIVGEKSVSVTGPGGPFVRNSVTSENPDPNAANPLIASVPPGNLNDLPMAFFGGTPVFYQFVITNCGTETLYNVRLDDCADERTMDADDFLVGGANGNCVEKPRLIPFNPQRIVAEKLEPGDFVKVTSADFPNDPISTVDICDEFGGDADRDDGIVRNDSQVEACTQGNPNCGSSNPEFVFFDDLNLVQCKERLAALGDRVWEDLNANGKQDCEDSNGNGILGDVDPSNPDDRAVSDQGTECGDSSSGGAGIGDVPVNLFQPDVNNDCTIDLNMQVVTGTDGLYLFENLDPGAYCVQFDITALPDDFCDTDGFALGAPQFTALKAVSDPAIDSDADPATGTTDALALVAGETNRTLDAGIVCPAKIGDRVWEDTDPVGLQGDEPGVGGVTVKLFGCGPDGIAGTADDVDTGETRVTDNVDGLYMFGAEPGVFDLEPGDYYVQFDPATFPPGFDFTVPKAGSDDSTDSDCLPPVGITACTTLGSRGINLNRDCGIKPPEPKCDFELNKKCRVETPPVSGDLECEAKIAATVLEYIGTGSPSVVTVEGKNNKAQVVSSFDPATGILTVDARPEDLGSKMTITTDGVAEVIHTSCSAPYVAGLPAPLDNPKGDPSENWLVLSFVDKNGGSASLPGDDNGMFTDSCSFTPGPTPSCDTLKANKEKPSSLTFAYTGGGCPGDNDQGTKSSCSGSIDPAEGVNVQAGEKVDNLSYPVDPMFVEPDGEFTIDPDKFKSNSVLVASTEDGTEINEIHTSCSQPLAVGDVFGSFTLVAMNGQPGSTEVTYQYVVTNKGDPLTGVLVTDVPLGDIGGPINLGTDESQTFTTLAQLVGTTVNTGTASGVLANGEVNGEVCSDSDTVTVEAVEPPPTPAECKELKPIDALILEYDASQAGDRSIETVAWYRDKFDPDDPTKNLISTTGPVTNGQVVDFDGFAAADAKNDVDFFIQFTDGSTATSRFHRSCSDEEMDDISDCGTLQGDGKKNDSGLNTWILRDLAGNGKVLGCP